MLFTGWWRGQDFLMARIDRMKLRGKPESLQVRKSPIHELIKSPRMHMTGRVSAAFPGSLTVETAFTLPFALFFLMTFFSFFSMMRVQVQVQAALEEAMNVVVERTVYQTDTPLTSQVLNEWLLKQQAAQQMNKVEGVKDISFEGTSVDLESEAAAVQVQYALDVKAVFFFGREMRFQQKSVRKLWTGVEVSGMEAAEPSWVYVAQHGSVYHLSQTCSHLRLSTRAVARDVLAELRNDFGSIYRVCEQCRPDSDVATVYITSQGDRFHGSLSCSGLKRTIRKVPLADVEGLAVCSRCGQKEE